MNRQGVKRNLLTMLLAVANGCLILIIALEWSWQTRQPNENSAPPRPDPELPVLQGSVLKTKASPLTEYEDIVQRPLFSASRRPVSGSEVDAQDKKLFALKGVVITPDRQQALLTMRGQQKVAIVEIGEWFGGWKIDAIEPLSVVMSKSGGVSMELMLERTPPEAQSKEKEKESGSQPREK